MPVAVVTDSTAYLPEGFAKRHDITVVPLNVLVDGERGLDGVDVGPVELIDALTAKRKVTTSMPNPEELAAAYRAALDSGSDAVVSVHLSRELSGTWSAAVMAAADVCDERGEGSVRVVDSRTTVMALGFAVLHAAEAAAAGATPADVETVAVETAASSRTVFVVPTLEYLRRGGRISSATALLGTALAMKPLLHIEDGRIRPLEKVRTMSKALSRLVELAVARAGDEPVELAVQHLGSPDRAALLADQLSEAIPKASGCVVSELGAVIGAHTGPGVFGVVVQLPPNG